MCPVCGSPRPVTDAERKGGLSQRQTKERLAKKITSDAIGMGIVRVRADGLAVRLVSPRGRRQWWCRWCDGNHPEKWRVGNADSLDDVFPEWDLHRETVGHQREMQVRRLSNETVDTLMQWLGETPSEA